MYLVCVCARAVLGGLRCWKMNKQTSLMERRLVKEALRAECGGP